MMHGVQPEKIRQPDPHQFEEIEVVVDLRQQNVTNGTDLVAVKQRMRVEGGRLVPAGPTREQVVFKFRVKTARAPAGNRAGR